MIQRIQSRSPDEGIIIKANRTELLSASLQPRSSTATISATHQTFISNALLSQ